jgi:hypothetical protein
LRKGRSSPRTGGEFEERNHAKRKEIARNDEKLEKGRENLGKERKGAEENLLTVLFPYFTPTTFKSTINSPPTTLSPFLPSFSSAI